MCAGEEREGGSLKGGEPAGPAPGEAGEGVEGVWQWFLANTKDPLATHFPSAPLSSPDQYTSCFYPWLLGVFVSGRHRLW